MSSSLKNALAAFAISRSLKRFENSRSDFDRLLGDAAQVQLKRLDEGEFRQRLHAFYSNLNLPTTLKEIRFEFHREKLDRPGGYKSRILSTAADDAAGGAASHFGIWRRRFGLLSRMGIDCDVMILRRDETIPPHGHHHVVSGFYVIEGEVAVRHFDRVEDRGDHLLLRKTIDADMGPGGFTTNSEFCDNIHWLQGLAPVSFLFRMNVKDTPGKTFGSTTTENQRLYIDPTGIPGESGLLAAPYVNGHQAAKLRIRACQEASTLLRQS